MRIQYFTAAVMLLCCTAAGAQSSTGRDSAIAGLQAMNRVFDSSAYTGFDVQVQYYTDTSAGKFYGYEKAGVYYLHKRNFYYREEQTEYMQNDSVGVYVDHELKMMTVSPKAAVPHARLLLKDFTDYALDAYYSNSWTTDLEYPDSNQLRIVFRLTGNPAAVPAYERFSVLMDTTYDRPLEFEAALSQRLPLNLPPQQTPVQPQPLRQYIRIVFTNERPVPGTGVFDAANYFVKDPYTGRLSPAPALRYYQLVNAGIEEKPAAYNAGQLTEPNR